MKKKIVNIFALVGIYLCFATPVFSGIGGASFELFRKPAMRQVLFELPTENYLHFGTLNGYRSTRANVGYDFSPGALILSSGKIFSFGFPAMVHIYMLPEGSIFHVDNFYAEFGMWLQVDLNKNTAVRLYPFYHRSAHLSDGYMNRGKDNPAFTGKISEDKRSVSNEVLYLTVLHAPKPWLELCAGAGWYFHTVSREDLMGRFDVSVFISPMIKYPFAPVFLLTNEFLYEKNIRYGIDGAVGLQVRNNLSRGVGFYFRLFDKPHPGQYYDHYERGMGLDIRFQL